jgi:hypothetical protein
LHAAAVAPNHVQPSRPHGGRGETVVLGMVLVKLVHALGILLGLTHCGAPEKAATTPTAPAASTQASATPAAATPQTHPAIAPPVTPAAIAVPDGRQVLLKALAKGVQIYACKAKEGAPATYEWTLKAPEAELFDEQGQKIGKHYAGPTWESVDGSKVVGKLRAKEDAPEGTAIPWLLLDVTSAEGTGVLTKVKNVQRVATAGGKAPTGGCDPAHANAETRIDYTATYYMYGP